MAEKIGEFYYTITAKGDVALNEMSGLEKKMGAIADRTASRIKNAFSRMFGIGAIIGASMMIVRQFYRAIEDGINRAIDNNKELKSSMEMLKLDFQLLFYNIGVMLIPIVKQLIEVGNFISNLFSKSQSAGMSKDMMEGMAKGLRYQLESGKLNEKQTREYTAALAELDMKLGMIYEKEKALAEIQKKKDEAAKKEVEDRIAKELKNRADVLKKQNDLIREQAQLVKSLADQFLGLFPKGEFTEFAGQLSEVVGLINNLTTGEDGSFDLGKAFENIMQSGDFITMAIKAVGSLMQTVENLTDEYNKNFKAQIEAAEDKRYKEYIKSLNEEVNKLTDALTVLEFIVSKERVIRNKTVEDINREIEAIEKTIEPYKELIRIRDEALNKSGLSTKKQADDEAARLKGMADAAKLSADYWLDQFQNNPFVNRIEAFTNFTAYMDQWKNLNNAAAEYTQWGIDIEAGNQAEIDSLTSINDLEDLRLEMETKRLEIMKAITNEMRNQKDLGILDVENVGDIRKIMTTLQGSGLSGLNLLTEASGMGIGNRAIRNTAIGSIIYNAYSASNNNLNLNGVIAQQTGE